MRYVPISTPAEDNSDGLENLGFNVISVKQKSATVDHLQKEQPQ
jgi:hypothetical protein